MGGPGARRRARGYALQVLYALDLNEEPSVDAALARFWAAFEQDEADPAAREFAEALVRSTVAQLREVDELVQQASKNWRLDRMSRVDRNILRLATWELLASPEVPVRVVINEAVELAKRFGAEDSPAFVNGILDRIAQPIRRE
jgi:N utilization substance protein B